MKIKFRNVALLALAMALAAVPLTAKADSTFGYTYVGNDGVFATGTLTGIQTAVGVYDITSGNITLSGAPACNNCGPLSGPLDGTGVFVQNPGTGVFQTGGGTELILTNTDSFLYPFSSQLIDDNGLFLFQMNGGLGVGLFSNEPVNPGYGMFGGNWTINDTGNLSLTPEPPSLLLLGTGLLGMAFLLFRRKAVKPVSHQVLSA